MQSVAAFAKEREWDTRQNKRTQDAAHEVSVLKDASLSSRSIRRVLIHSCAAGPENGTVERTLGAFLTLLFWAPQSARLPSRRMIGKPLALPITTNSAPCMA